MKVQRVKDGDGVCKKFGEYPEAMWFKARSDIIIAEAFRKGFEG